MQPEFKIRRLSDGSIDFDVYRRSAARRRLAAKRLAGRRTRKLATGMVMMVLELVNILKSVWRSPGRLGSVPGACAAAFMVTALAAQVLAQSSAGHHGGAGDHTLLASDELRWAAPAAYTPGAQLAVLKGDPTKEGLYVVRLKVPAGFIIAPHTHPNDENVTVLSGSFNIGTGDKLDLSKGASLKTGGYSYVAKGMSHYAWFAEETVLQLHGMGPQGVTYVNSTDDPRKK